MNTNQIQRFATQARNILLAGVNAKLNLLGFNADGSDNNVIPPSRYSDSTVFQGRVIPGTRFFEQWMELYNRIKLIGFDDVCEEAAYTWFNRLVALRILQKNGIIQPVIEYDNPAVKVPRIVNDARRGKYDFLMPSDRQQLNEVIDDDTRLFEQFQVLITAYCHNHPILKACFGGITGYTELLLPNNILVDGNFIDLLNNTDYLTDDDYRQSELIGWLYQFYISEKKDEVFASFKDGNKAEADQIPAATQIFTPNWIVKYMVQNTAGRIYLDNHPNSPLKDSWKYLVEAPEPVEGSPSVRGQGGVLKLQNLESLTCADLSCGSGHILGEFFDLLYQIYDDELYDPRDAVEKILTHNILGIDLDTRAKQLSMFALLLKACQKDISFADAHCLPRVLDMPKPIMHRKDGVAIGDEANFSDYDGYLIASQFLDKFFSGTASEETKTQILQNIALMADANNLGSIMRFDITPEVRYSITQAIKYWKTKDEVPVEVQNIMPSIQLLLALTDKYVAVVMNPPYMGSGNMNGELSQYVKDNYEKGKADLCTAFMLMQAERTLEGGFYANIVPPSWMFLSTFEPLRRQIIDEQSIHSLLHLSRGVFGADFGSVSTVIQNHKNEAARGTYFRLIERTFQEFDQKHLKLLFEKTLANHDFRYYFADYTKDVTDIVYSKYGAKIYYPYIPQSNFKIIPGCPLGYWVSEIMISHFTQDPTLESIANLRSGISTGDNDRFYRVWHECDNKKISPNYHHTPFNSSYKWFKIIRGGTFRKWYGCCDNVINLENSCYEIENSGLNHRLRTPEYYTKLGITWNRIASGQLGFRIKSRDFNFGENSPCMFMVDGDSDLFSTMAVLNCKCIGVILKALNPTMSNQVADLLKLPIATKVDSKEASALVQENISISKADWDVHETSWDFQENELIRLFKQGLGTIRVGFENASQNNFVALDMLVEEYKAYWMDKFNQLHHNEEELNRQFIEIYGLQDELSPNVPLEEVTILQQGELMFIPAPGSENWKTPIWCEDNIIQQFISYAIGCYMGRYRLDRPGLHIAHPNPTAEELAPYEVPELVEGSCLASRSPESFSIDEDAIIPILPIDAPFPDNAANRITNFVKLVFGTDNINENMNFIQDALGMSVADYMAKNFYADHKKRYQNRPIYWLFSSKKGAFQCLVYMHRMNRFTVGRIRDNYLLPYIQHLETKLSELNVNAALLSSAERKEQKRKLAILQECREYDNILHLFADRQIDFDLDDGVLHNYSIFKDILAKLK